MGFKFHFLCDLLSSLENNRIIKASTEARNINPDARVVSRWFAQHEKRLRGKDTDQLALLSCVFPEKRPDRVYSLQDTSLARVIGRCLLLGSSRREELERWRVSGGMDLGQCVENVMRQAENHIIDGQEVTVEEIDYELNRIASRCRFSGPKVRRQRTAVDVEEALSPIYRRLNSRDAKWFTRMVLKSYYPVVLPERLTLRSVHFLLPHLLLFQDSLEAALNMLASDAISQFPPHPEPALAKNLGAIALQHLTPGVGVKIGRLDYSKARSIKHCCKMIGNRRMSIERKYDGEYCQIHIDLSRPQNSIQIFSKSGKDSTEDRAGIHQVVRDALRIGRPGCKVSRRCILEGELLVWSEKHGNIADFHKLRKFVSRSGTFIGTESDSPPQPYEHLMIVFFDILLLDDDVCLRKPHRERRLLLKDAIEITPGHADISEQRVLDFSHHGSQSRLESIFAKGVAERWEGFVLKGCEDPYFTIFSVSETNNYGRWIKLKKDYIPGLGDTVDLAIIGGSYNSRDAVALDQIKQISWTHFFVGCLVNKDAVTQSAAVPRFRVINVIDRNCMHVKNMQILNQLGEFSACDPESGHGFAIEYGQDTFPSMTAVFKTPFVAEMLGSGFEKRSGARYFTLRFPRILKLHWDRSFEDAATYTELQLLAEDARSVAAEDLAEEENEWTKRLKVGGVSSRYIVDQSQSARSTTASSQSGTNPDDGLVLSRQTTVVSRMDPRGSTRSIPIYVDDSTDSNSSFDDADGHGNFLASNDNLSSHQDSRQRKHSIANQEPNVKPASTDINTQSENIKGSNEMDLSNSTIPSPSPEKHTHHDPNTHHPSTTRTIPKKQKPKRSPLPTLPIYINTPLPNPTNHPNLLNTLTPISNLTTFLQTLIPQTPNPNPTNPTSSPAPSPPGTTLGLTLIKTHDTPLHETLLHLSTTISKYLQTRTTQHSKGKIFLLDSSFLDVDTTADDTRFYLRETWRDIAREYFYACVSWDSTVCSEMVDNAVDEVAGAAVGDGVRVGKGKSKVFIGFDKEEVCCLGGGYNVT